MSGIHENWKFNKWDVDTWNSLAREIISASAVDELHTVEECEISNGEWKTSWIGTPLLSLFLGFTTRVRESWTDGLNFTLRNWLEQLNECGIDLLQYGQREQAYLSRRIAETGFGFQATFTLTYCKQPMELREIKFGPEPEDWVMFWGLDVFQMAGDFFEMVVEQQQRASLPTYKLLKERAHSSTARSRMPGGWVD
jgi:hypothetical protein